MSKDAWEKVDVREFLADVAKAKSEALTGTHRFVKRKRLPWPFCAGCGLLLLSNRATERARKAGCFK